MPDKKKCKKCGKVCYDLHGDNMLYDRERDRTEAAEAIKRLTGQKITYHFFPHVCKKVN
jgi:Fe-S-cluster containining protein